MSVCHDGFFNFKSYSSVLQWFHFKFNNTLKRDNLSIRANFVNSYFNVTLIYSPHHHCNASKLYMYQSILLCFIVNEKGGNKKKVVFRDYLIDNYICSCLLVIKKIAFWEKKVLLSFPCQIFNCLSHHQGRCKPKVKWAGMMGIPCRSYQLHSALIEIVRASWDS